MRLSVRGPAASASADPDGQPPTSTAGTEPSATVAAIRSASPIAIAGLVANVANIGVTLVVARLLTTRGYGALNQLVAVFFVLSIPGSALLVGIVRRITGWQRAGQEARVAGWAYRTRRRALVLVVIWTIIAIAIRGPLSRQLSIPAPEALAEILVAGGMWGVLCLERGLLQAHHAYRGLGANLLVEGLSRCLLTVILVGAGFGVTGAALSILLSILLAEVHGLIVLGSAHRRDARRPVEGLWAAGLEPWRERRSLAVDLLTALSALALLAILQNFDVVLLGREAPGNAGSYAPLSVASKPLPLAAFVLAGFLLPEAASRRHAGEHALRQLGVVLAVIAAPAALLITLSAAVPSQLLRTVFGPRLTGAAPAFATLACAMTLLAASVLFTHYLLAAGRPLVLLVLVLGAGLTVWLLVRADGAPVATARADLIGQGAVALATGLLVLHTARPRGHQQPVR